MKTMRNSGVFIIVVLLFSVHIIGCKQEGAANSPREEQVQEKVGTSFPGLKFSQDMRGTNFIPIEAPQQMKERFKGKSKMSELTEAERKELKSEAIQSFRVRNRIDSLMYWESDWQEADRKIREVLEANVNTPQFFATEQIAANKMLTLRLLGGELTADKQEPIAYYTKLLLHNNHPDAEVISQAFEALDGHWTRADIARAAAQTARHAREYLKQNPCRPCLEGTGVKEKLLDAQQRKLYKMQNSLPKLDELAKRES